METPAQGREALGFSFAREQVDDRLQLRALHRPTYGAIAADWLDAGMRSRIQGGKRQPLARALALHKQADIHILDATAGLGRDGYTLAALGARVTLCERHADIHALLLDALRRAHEMQPAIAARIELIHADALATLRCGQHWDAVYLDPMYPDDTRTALPQKEMQIFRDLTGGDADADALLPAALASARKRVVVKRPLKAPVLAGMQPTLQAKGTQARFDIYLKAPGA